MECKAVLVRRPVKIAFRAVRHEDSATCGEVSYTSRQGHPKSRTQSTHSNPERKTEVRQPTHGPARGRHRCHRRPSQLEGVGVRPQGRQQTQQLRNHVLQLQKGRIKSGRIGGWDAEKSDGVRAQCGQ